MSLTAEERDFMRASGNAIQRVADPVDYDREEVIYPVSFKVHKRRNTLSWIVEKGREYEPLAANYGRYMLLGACKYLVTDENGWERCGVYDERPQVCRDFEMGSPKCLTLRQLAGLD